MKTFIFLTTIFIATTIFAKGPVNAPSGTTYMRPNLSGGYNFYNKSRYTGRAVPNNAGNYNYYDNRGYMYGRGRESVGGTYRFNYYDGR